jgi:hypothetical protein
MADATGNHSLDTTGCQRQVGLSGGGHCSDAQIALQGGIDFQDDFEEDIACAS